MSGFTPGARRKRRSSPPTKSEYTFNRSVTYGPRQRMPDYGNSSAMSRHGYSCAYGNHPSFVMMSLGNESYVPGPIMAGLLRQWKSDPRRVYTGPCNAPGSIVAEYDYCVARKVGQNRIRYQDGWPPKPDGAWFVSRSPQTAIDYRDAVREYGKPLVSHEVVQRCCYPDLEQEKKYTGSLRAAYPGHRP